MTRQELIIPAKDVEIWINVYNRTIKLDTTSQISKTWVQTLENIYAIGTKDPIGVADSNASYSSNLSLQTGEYHVLLNAINALAPPTGLHASFLTVPAFTLTIAHKMLNLITPSTVSTALFNCRVSEDSDSTSANESATYTTLALQGTGLKRDVSPIQ